MIFQDVIKIKILNTDLILDRLSYLTKKSKHEILNLLPVDKIEKITTSILNNRNFDIDSFNNLENNFINPYLLKNAEEAADIITRYLNDNNSIILGFFDYDVDGQMAAYVMNDVLMSLTKGYVNATVPERKDGYGLNMAYCEETVKLYKNTNYNVLVITADNGISKKEEVKYLKDNGIEVIVTDHHVAEEGSTPDCLIVDPHNKLEPQNDIYDHLCGCGVVFKLCQIIKYNFGQEDMLKYTPYVALATIADVMPLTDENISFISYGLETINSKNCPIGIMKLKYKKFIKNMTVNDIAWTISPIINSCGRLNQSFAAYSLLRTKNYKEAEQIADYIDEINENRKKITKKALEELEKINFENNKVCICISDKYEVGILGILAGRLSQSNKRITIMAHENDSGICNGSVRSYKNINILTLLKEMKETGLIISCGGHDVSCAVSFNKNKIEQMNKFFNEHIEYPEETEEENEIIIDGKISFEDFNEYFYDLVNLFPCDNKTFQNPIFKMENLKVLNYEKNEKSIKLNFKDDKCIYIWGNPMKKYIEELNFKQNISVIGEIKKNFKNYNLNVLDIF